MTPEPMNEALKQLEHLRDLASLEGFARLDDLEALLSVARSAPQETQRQLALEATRLYASLPGTARPEQRNPDLGQSLEALVNLIAGTGLHAAPFAALEGCMSNLLAALEDAHRQPSGDPLESAGFAALEALKTALFGRALNVAERARLRGLYERSKLLRSW